MFFFQRFCSEWNDVYSYYIQKSVISLLFLTCIQIESVNKTFNFQHFIEVFYSKSTCFRPKNSSKRPHWEPWGWIGWGWIAVISERFCPESMIQMSESSDFFWLVGWLVAQMCENVCLCLCVWIVWKDLKFMFNAGARGDGGMSQHVLKLLLPTHNSGITLSWHSTKSASLSNFSVCVCV